MLYNFILPFNILLNYSKFTAYSSKELCDCQGVVVFLLELNYLNAHPLPSYTYVLNHRSNVETAKKYLYFVMRAGLSLTR